MDQKTREEITKKSSMLADFPCLSEKKLVDKCYERTEFDKDACKNHIVNYQTCKSFWAAVEKSRRLQKVKPFKPGPEERIKIKAYFKEHKKLPIFPIETETS